MRRVEAPGPGGADRDLDRLAAGAGDAPLPTVVDVHGGPLGAWAPAPHVEVVLLAVARLPGRPAEHPRLGQLRAGLDPPAARRLGRRRRRRRPCRARPRHRPGAGRPGPARRAGALLRRVHGQLADRHVRTASRAAVSENGVTNQVSSWANSDSGPEYDRAALLGDPFTPGGGREALAPVAAPPRRADPDAAADAPGRGRPALPAADNEQLFIALRHLGREVEYVLYPEEWHIFASTGRPDRRIDRNERMLDWFDRYLKG